MRSPLSKSVEMMLPRKGEDVLQDRKRKTIEWQSAATIVQDRTINIEAGKLEWFLYAFSSRIISTAGSILVKLLARPTMEPIKQFVVDRLRGAEATADSNEHIVSGIRAFLAHHPTKGQRVKEEQDALDAVLVASTFTLTDNDPKSAVAKQLGARPNSILEAFARAKTMIASRLPYARKERKQRSDCYRDAARACIHDFCHSEEGSNVDTESYRVYKIKDPDTGEVSNHPARVWNETTMAKRYQSFLESEMYKIFKETSLGDKTRTISREVFRQEVCECVRDPSPQSCVDLRMSALSEYMKGIRKACINNPAIKKRLDECTCVAG